MLNSRLQSIIRSHNARHGDLVLVGLKLIIIWLPKIRRRQIGRAANVSRM